MSDLAHLAPRARDDERALFLRARRGDLRARERLVERYLPLARSLARRIGAKHGESREDLAQVAGLGLVHAVDRFQPERGVAFSSFAVPTILGELRRHLRDRSWSVRPPRRLQELWLALTAARARLEGRLGREPTAEELAAELGVGVEDVLEAIEAGRAQLAGSLDAPQDEDGNPLGALQGALDPGYDEVELRAGLELAARRLTARQRAVLWLHVDGDLTQDAIAKFVGVSQMQVSRDLRDARRALAGWFDGED